MTLYVTHGPYPRRMLVDYLDDAARGIVPSYARSVPTGAPQTVALPRPPCGQHMLANMTLDQHPAGSHWDAPSFTSVTPWACIFEAVTVHGDGGIVMAGGAVVQDTLAHCDPLRHGFVEVPDGFLLASDGPPTRLDGVWLSLLGGGHQNYYHWLLEGIGRIGAADSAILAQCGGLLLPASVAPFVAETLAMCGIAERRRVRIVEPMDVLLVERMVVPWRMADQFWPHPRLATFFAGLRPDTSHSAGLLPRRIYIDRRGATNRRLVNEDAVVAGLARFGVVAVQTEALSVAAKAAMFGAAELVVGPHGAGLTNLVFARPGCIVVELLADGYVNWCFRRLAATFGLPYDCVIGRIDALAKDVTVHGRDWMISVLHVQAAVAAALER